MAEYIERETAIKNIKEHQCRNCYDIGLCENCAVLTAIKLFENIPAVDVQPVKHGEWSQIKILQDGYKAKECSVCKATFWDLYPWNYCANCGAKMDGEDNGRLH